METYYPGLTRTHEIEEPQRGREQAANVGDTERFASVLAGSAMAVAGLRRIDSLRGIGLVLLGGGLLYRGASGRCHLYRALGINTAERNPATGVPAHYGEKVETSIVIHRTPAAVYGFWRDLENLPTFMSHLACVEAIDANRSHWVAKGPLGTRLEWDAEIINEKEAELIAWRSLAGSTVDTAGSVHFVPRSDGRETELRISLKYNPPGGKLTIGMAHLLGESPQQQIEADLQSLKQFLEGAGMSAPNEQSPARDQEREAAESPRWPDEVEEASDESFPASDPPAWTDTAASRSIMRSRPA